MKNEKRFSILSVLDTTISDSWQFLKNWKVLFSYALVLAFWGILSGNWSHTCKESLSLSWWCASVGSAYAAYARMAVYFLGAIFLSFSFCYDIYQKKSGFFAVFKLSREKLKFMGFAICLCALFFVSLGICVWLIFRKADPNWLVEFGFFLIVFAFATIAVLILRTSASFGLFLQNGKIPDFKQLFKLTSGKFYVVLITFCVLTYAINILQMHALGILEVWNIKKTLFVVAVASEVMSSVLKFIVLIAYCAYFAALAECLLPEQFVKAEPANDIKPVTKVGREKRKTETKPARAKKSAAKRRVKKKQS